MTRAVTRSFIGHSIANDELNLYITCLSARCSLIDYRNPALPLSIPSPQQGGVYLVEFLNVYGPGLAILFVVFIESAGVFWFYGVDNFSNDIKQMLGHRPGIFWRFCWKYISPVFLLVVCIFSFLGHEDMLNPDFKYPSWTEPLGLLLTASSVMCIPIYIVYKFFVTSGGPYRVS